MSPLLLLPPGSTAQPAWGFRDESGRFTYEFNRVYGPAQRLRDRIDIEGQRLDEGSSYWVVTWLEAVGTFAEHTCGRWITYAQARKLEGSRLTFARFSTLGDMREDLPDLLRATSRHPPTTMEALPPTGARVRPLNS